MTHYYTKAHLLDIMKQMKKKLKKKGKKDYDIR